MAFRLARRRGVIKGVIFQFRRKLGGLKNREETVKENENGDIARGGRGRESLLPSFQFTHDGGLFGRLGKY